MGVRITWEDRNLAEDGHKIYRSTSPMDTQNMPAPLATLGPDVELYDDGSVAVDTTYYYIVSALAGSMERFSAEVSVTTTETTWTPAQLFLGGEVGGCWNFNDISTLFKDTAGTIPVTAAGDAIARVNDISGNGNHLTQTTSTARMNYGVSGSEGYGIGNVGSGSGAKRYSLRLPAPVSYPFTLAVGGDSSPGTSGSVGLTISDDLSNNNCVFALGTRGADVTGPAIAIYNTSNGYNDASIGNAKSKFACINSFLTGGSFAEGHAGGSTAGTPLNFNVPTNTDLLTIGALIRSTSTSSYAGNYSFALFIDRELTPQEKTELFTWAKNQVGIV